MRPLTPREARLALYVAHLNYVVITTPEDHWWDETHKASIAAAFKAARDRCADDIGCSPDEFALPGWKSSGGDVRLILPEDHFQAYDRSLPKLPTVEEVSQWVEGLDLPPDLARGFGPKVTG